jgi:hypothetical protein
MLFETAPGGCTFQPSCDFFKIDNRRPT